jgi:uncharacterized repeat protein (TIGR03943 family)
VTRLGRAAVLLVVGAVAMWLALSGDFGQFLQQRMRWPLAAAGFAILAIGIAESVIDERRRRVDPSASRSQAAPIVGWLVLLPLIVLMAVAPTALGSTAAQRARGLVPEREQMLYPDLPDSDSPIPLRMYDFINQAVFDPEHGLRGHEIELRGFVVNDAAYPDGLVLVRFALNCCAADGYPMRVAFPETDVRLPNDTWITAVVVWRPPKGGRYFDDDKKPLSPTGELYIEAELVSYTVMETPPDSPYESPFSP